MYVVWTVSCFAHEQPSEDVWAALAAAADSWQPEAGAGFEASQPFMRLATVASEEARDALLDLLRAVPGAVVNTGPSTRLEEGDFATADFVGVFASTERLVVTNGAEALSPVGPCPVCGLQDAFDVVQALSFVVAGEAADGHTSTLPAGGFAATQRTMDLLQQVGTAGLAVRELSDARTGRPATYWSQVLAERLVLVPCTRHTQIHGDPFCDRCGAGRGDVVGYTWFRREDVDGVDIFSRHPSGRTMFYLARRVVTALTEAGVDDLIESDVVRVCDCPTPWRG